MSLTKVSYSMITGAPINVEDYGAIGDGVTDNAAALQAAFDAGVYVVGAPGATYKCNAQLNIQNKTFFLADIKILFASNNGIVYTSNDSDTILNVTNVGLYSASPATGTALSAVWFQALGAGNGNCLFSNVKIENFGSSANYWNTGINVTSGYNVLIDTCFIVNPSNIVNSPYGIKINGTSTTTTIQNCFIFKVGTAVLAEGFTYNIKVINCEFTRVDIGVDFAYNNIQYGAILHVLDSKLFTLSYGVRGVNSIALSIMNNFFQKSVASSWVGVYLSQGTDVGAEVSESIISHNQFGNQYGETNPGGGGPWEGIIIENNRVVTITENIFDSGSGTCINLLSTARECIVKNNTNLQSINFTINDNKLSLIKDNYSVQTYGSSFAQENSVALVNPPSVKNIFGNYANGYVVLGNASGVMVNVAGFSNGIFWQTIHVRFVSSDITLVNNTLATDSKLDLQGGVNYVPGVNAVVSFISVPSGDTIIWREFARRTP